MDFRCWAGSRTICMLLMSKQVSIKLTGTPPPMSMLWLERSSIHLCRTASPRWSLNVIYLFFSRHQPYGWCLVPPAEVQNRGGSRGDWQVGAAIRDWKSSWHNGLLCGWLHHTGLKLLSNGTRQHRAITCWSDTNALVNCIIASFAYETVCVFPAIGLWPVQGMHFLSPKSGGVGSSLPFHQNQDEQL